ncbi:fibrinogen-like protein A [Clavelina lepadiformis]|uniref:fibrinogen-like protein A n=1 Tax=Clavelina lepadiformis TaxID=159417 RepID=UPI0040439078
MRGVILLLSLACFVVMTYSQECRQVLTTVCADDVVNSTMQKEDKDDVGRSRKSGSPEAHGAKGEPGAVGQKGMQGESCALGSLGTDIVTRLAKIEELLTPPSTTAMATTTVVTTTSSTATSTVATTTPSSITSCSTSSSNGPHNLTSGVEVYCEDGWTIFQRRIDGSVDFGRRWDDYANGFGQINGEFWLGLDNIHEMTRGGGCRLKIELWDFDGNQRHANYSSFAVESAKNLYRLRVSGYSGNAGDSLRFHNGRPFSTEDNDNDSFRVNCATRYGGSQGWWFDACAYSFLNGVWMRQSSGIARGIIWYDWKGWLKPLKETKMKLRCD